MQSTAQMSFEARAFLLGAGLAMLVVGVAAVRFPNKSYAIIHPVTEDALTDHGRAMWVIQSGVMALLGGWLVAFALGERAGGVAYFLLILIGGPLAMIYYVFWGKWD